MVLGLLSVDQPTRPTTRHHHEFPPHKLGMQPQELSNSGSFNVPPDIPLEDFSIQDERINIHTRQEVALEREQHPKPPSAFFCPISRKIMFDPVLDSRGDSYERTALQNALRSSHGEDATQKEFVPNNALREAIHRFMGEEWVAREQQQCELPYSQRHAQPAISHHSTVRTYRTIIDNFLSRLPLPQGMFLRLDDGGCCHFFMYGMKFTIDVPETAGIFCIYTRSLVSDHEIAHRRGEIFERALELNFLQVETKGGCLSIQRRQGNVPTLTFSYTQKIRYLTGDEFANILDSFADTALRIHHDLRGVLSSWTLDVR